MSAPGPALLLAGRIARSEQDFSAALSHFERAAALTPGAEVLLERARTLDVAGMRDGARDAWRAVLAFLHKHGVRLEDSDGHIDPGFLTEDFIGPS